MPSSTMIPPDQEPEDVVVDAVRERVTRWWRRLIDWGRTWSTAKLAAIAVTGLVSLVGAAVALPWAAAAGCTIVVVISLVLAVAARRLMFVERARRRWQEVGLIRMEQRALRAERALDVAILALVGDPRVLSSSQRIHPDVRRALAHHDQRLRESAAKEAAQRAARRAPAEFDVEPVRARLAEREAELKALEAATQSLADTSDRPAYKAARETAREARHARNAALEADRVARDRRRRGLRATAPEGEHTLRVTLDATGNQNVTTAPKQRTPEEISLARRAAPVDGS